LVVIHNTMYNSPLVSYLNFFVLRSPNIQQKMITVRQFTWAHCVAHILRMEVVLVSATATIHKLLTLVVSGVEVPAWGLRMAWPNIH
jgi:hypothetical protein